ncbi:MAG: ATP-dependent DNA helicase [Puniceicoccaceae bacterium]|nr:MAG: ATP-dependent DNA helicase [Puniceicoccaceae bacterium]
MPQAEGCWLIREVKTIRTPLPAPDEVLIEQYAEHFAQVSIYRALLATLPEYERQSIQAEVQFINIENGARQSVALEAQEYGLFEQQLEALWPFLEERRSRCLRLREAEIQPAFEVLREGQADLFASLSEAALQAKVVLMQAPTGFGKTGIVLEHALKHMQRGFYERCIYLSSKSTGQLETIRQLRRMIGEDLRFMQMRNRREHMIESPRHTCTGDERCNEQLEHYWREADLNPPDCFTSGTVTLEQAQAIGAATGVCPYALTKACLPFAELWIGDSNYVFAPDSQSVFSEVQGFNPAQTLLIIDEAHNLPERTADSLSVELKASELLFAIEELREHGAPRRLLSIASEIARWIESLTPERALNPSELYLGLDLCEDFGQQLQLAAFDYTATAPFALELVWRIPRLTQCLAAPPHAYLNWIPASGRLEATCLDPSEWIQQCLQPFAGAILMSATLEPFSSYEASCGLPLKSATRAIGHAPWREQAYDVAIDRRVDTRLRSRANHYETTAHTVAHCIAASPGVPVVVFFSSYLYADNVLAYAEAGHPELRIQRQPRGGSLEERNQFIEESLLTADALFLILGSSYAEGIDLLGGRVYTIMIVGPALPEVNQIQKTKIEQHGSFAPEVAFRDVYIRPAMRRIHQALGRIVRAPGQHARVLLHDRRFAEPAYQEELAPEYQSQQYIENEHQLIEWLTATRLEP